MIKKSFLTACLTATVYVFFACSSVAQDANSSGQDTTTNQNGNTQSEQPDFVITPDATPTPDERSKHKHHRHHKPKPTPIPDPTPEPTTIPVTNPSPTPVPTSTPEPTPTATPTPTSTPSPTPTPVSSNPPATSDLAVCGVASLLTGPSTAPSDAVVVPAGDNSNLSPAPNTTYYFAAGTHTLGSGQFAQIQPANGDTFIGAPGAIIDGQLSNLYAFVGTATNVTIEYLTIQNFGPAGSNNGAGVVNHDSGSGWTIQYNTVQNNAGAGVFLGSNSVTQYNCLINNGEYGYSSYAPNGISNVQFSHNEVAGNNTYNWETAQQGCGCSGGGKFWATNKATVTYNWFHNNHQGPGLWADTNNNDFDIEDNLFTDNDNSGIIYEISYNALIQNNIFTGNAVATGPSNGGFPNGAIYISESGGDSRVPGRYNTIDINSNTFTDNWSGVVLWENSNRFCNSPDNSSSGDCTLVNPTVVNLNTCVTGTIKNAPYFSDCRWKTQNVVVENNTFNFNPDNVAGCNPSAQGATCGQQGLFSEYGTDPSWSPYQGTIVEQNITFNQNNVFKNNKYTGPWSIVGENQGNIITPILWQAAPYKQDVGSTFTGR